MNKRNHKNNWRDRYPTLYSIASLIWLNLPRQKASYKSSTSVVPTIPHALNIETTNTCNLNCLMCQTKLSRRPKGYMDLSLYRKVIGLTKDEGISEVQLFTVGEPFMHKEIGEHLRIASKNNLHAHLSTNGQILGPQHIQYLLEFPPAGIQFSVDGATKETYEKVRRGGDFERLISNLHQLRDNMEKANIHIPITIKSVILEENTHELLLFFDVFKEFVDGIRNISFHFPDTLSADEEKTWFKKLGYKPASKIPCSLLWSTPSVLWDGQVSACCRDFHGELIMGNIFEETLFDIWHGERYNSIRRKHLSGNVHDVSPCNKCISAGTLLDSHKLNAYLHMAYTHKLFLLGRLIGRVFLPSHRELIKKCNRSDYK